jgi:hypothetical protein
MTFVIFMGEVDFVCEGVAQLARPLPDELLKLWSFTGQSALS